MAKAALDADNRVVATARKPEETQKALGKSDNLLCVALDVTKDNQIQAAVKAAVEHFGRIDVLVNNAGYGQLGFFEETSESLIRQQFDVNVFGTMAVTRAVLPIMREQHSGMVITISSIGGVLAFEGSSSYNASKFALEGWAEGQHIDLKPLGIQSVLVEPGAFLTDFQAANSAKHADIIIDDYANRRAIINERFAAQHHNQPGDPRKLAKALLKVVNDPNPPVRFIAGEDAVMVIEKDLIEQRRIELEAWRQLSSSMAID